MSLKKEICKKDSIFLISPFVVSNKNLKIIYVYIDITATGFAFLTQN